jgi:hypothetical protein
MTKTPLGLELRVGLPQVTGRVALDQKAPDTSGNQVGKCALASRDMYHLPTD